MKEKWLKWSKISLLLVCLGFFMPVSCDMNGVDLARMFNQMQSPGYAILIWLVLITAIISIIFTLTHTKDLEKESVIVDWILLGGSISGGLFSLGRMSREYFNLQVGAYVIIAGWILSLIFLIIASCSHTQKGS
ncbi:MAG: hypothetical protein SPJ93_05075 [Treponema sp.]|nr:hypothetical protein [Treponema sp.]